MAATESANIMSRNCRLFQQNRPEGDIPRKIVGQNPAGWAERRLNIKAALGQ
jgi:hypothetical protein